MSAVDVAGPRAVWSTITTRRTCEADSMRRAISRYAAEPTISTRRISTSEGTSCVRGAVAITHIPRGMLEPRLLPLHARGDLIASTDGQATRDVQSDERRRTQTGDAIGAGPITPPFHTPGSEILPHSQLLPSTRYIPAPGRRQRTGARQTILRAIEFARERWLGGAYISTRAATLGLACSCNNSFDSTGPPQMPMNSLSQHQR